MPAICKSYYSESLVAIRVATISSSIIVCIINDSCYPEIVVSAVVKIEN